MNNIITLIILLILISCTDKHTLMIKNFNEKGIKKYLKEERNIDIDSDCGLHKNIEIKTPNTKKGNINIFISCNFYTGDLNLNKNKKYKNLDNIIVINTISKSYALNGIEYTLNDLKTELKKEKSNVLDLYVERNDWQHTEGLEEFIDAFSEHYILTFGYPNELFKKSLKPFDFDRIQQQRNYPVQLPHE